MTNTQVITNGLETSQKIIDARILNALVETALTLESLRPFNIRWTGNLLDSIGCGIYKDGSLRKYYTPPRIATEPRSGDDEFPIDSRQVEGSESPLWEVPNGVDEDKAWWGEDQLFQMILNPPAEIQQLIGWALYYVAAMPYSQIVDEANNGDVLAEESIPKTFMQFIKIAKV